jgi:hypothetical protein
MEAVGSSETLTYSQNTKVQEPPQTQPIFLSP